MLIITLRWHQRATAAQVELLPQHRDRAATGTPADKRPEIFRPILLPHPCEGKPRDRVIQVNLDQQIILVIPKTDIISRFEFFN